MTKDDIKKQANKYSSNLPYYPYIESNRARDIFFRERVKAFKAGLQDALKLL